MAKQWIVVADAAAARLFSRENAGSLARVEAFYHDQSRKHEGDLRTGGKGEVEDSAAHGRHQADPQTRTSEKHEDIFAKQVAARLKSGLNDNAFDELVLVAAPQFLGRLRDHLDSPLSRHVVATIDKDWTNQKDSEIEKHLDLQLG
ncbi:host attachment protein [Salinisphaera sp.]|uniref:host attachment protein n=1 Tax=Salinisphaera sp. TaxID=1914330 RepID=UPI002D76CFA2|nr:host attachment protein [Salinisphaera sp.]HET7315384.1 host attachment protein [Salinisphaera sp.]